MCNLSTINNFKKKETTVAVGEVYDKASRGGGGHFYASQLFWWQGHSIRVLDSEVCLRLSPCREGSRSAPQPTAAPSVSLNVPCFPLRFHPGHWSLLCMRPQSTRLNDPLSTLRYKYVVVCYPLYERSQTAPISTLTGSDLQGNLPRRTQWIGSCPDTH